MNTALVPVGSTLVIPNNRLHIAGLDGLDESDQAIPYIRVVQPTSTECKLMDGSDAKAGQFYDTALMKAHNELQFAVLAVAKFDVTWQEDKEPQRIYLLLCADRDYYPFVLKVSGTSIFALKQLITSITRTGVAASWYFWVRAITEKRESTKDGQPRKWFSIRFYIIGEADEQELQIFADMTGKYTLGEALPPLEPDEIG
jgi:hypothetical protein